MALPARPLIVIVRLGLAKETTVPTLIGVHAAKTTLSRLIEQAAAGEEIVITRNGEPVARLIPVAPVPRRQFEMLRGLGKVGSDPRLPLVSNDCGAIDSR